MSDSDPFYQSGHFNRVLRRLKKFINQLTNRKLFPIEHDLNRPFRSCFEPHYESEAKCKVFIMKISCHSSAEKITFYMKSLVLSLAFIMRFTATRKWPISPNMYNIAAHFSLNSLHST